MGIKIEQQTYELLETGEYPAEITEIALENGQFGEQLKFTFELDNGRSMWGWASAKFSTKSKLYAWTRAILNRDIPPSYMLDTDDLLGKRVKVIITQEEREDGREFNKITRLKPYTNGTGGTNGHQPVAPPPAPESPPVYMGGEGF